MSITVGLAIVSTVEHAAGITTELLGLAALAGTLGAIVALAYRSFADRLLPHWLGVFAGVSGVVVYLGATPALEMIVREGVQPSETETALFNVGALLVGAGGAVLGRAVGDRFGRDVLPWSPTQDIDEDVSRLAQTVGQVTRVSLPRQIEDASGYDPVPKRTKDSLAGTKLVFPRGLTIEEVEKRITARLESDYGIGTVDVEFDADGDVSYLAVGTRAAGIGSTLPPATNAIALRADPGFAASTGDIVQVWEPDTGHRVLTGEVRGIVDDVVTIAVDAGDTPKVDPSREYRLVTLPVEDRPDREFASLLRTAAETFSTVTVEAGSPLHGLPVGSLDLTVTVIRPDNDEPVPFPDGTYRLLPGDLLFVIAPASELRRLEAASEPLDPSIASDRGTVSTDSVLPDERSQTVDQTATTGDNPSSGDEVPAIDQPATQDEWAETERPTGQADPVESVVEEKATADSFKEMKAEFDGTDAADEQERDKAQDNEDDTESSTTSFGELKAEFDAGEADWDEPQTEREQDPKQQESEQQESPADNENDELVRLEEAEITFDDEETDSETDSAATSEADNSVQEESASDDLESLEFDDDAEETGNLDLDATDELFSEIGDESVDDTETAVTGEETDTGDGNGRGEPPGEGEQTEEKAMAGEDEANDADSDDDETNNDEDDDEESSGGGKSFAELKDEFESGEADWEEDVSDSPGGDMRLDE